MKKKELQLVKTHLDKIYDTSVEITVAFNSEYIPLNTLWELLNRSKLKKDKRLKGFDDNYNKMLDVLYTVSKGYCETYELNKRLPMVVFKRYIKELKDNL